MARRQTFSTMDTEFRMSISYGACRDIQAKIDLDRNLEDIMSSIWRLRESHEYLTPKLVVADKSEADAQRLRSDGNEYYQKNMLTKALEYYNLSIMVAPHPPVHLGSSPQAESDEAEDQPSSEKYTTLSYGYANRSAVLFRLGHHEKCLVDIDLAFKYGLPKLLHSKLAERKAKCLIALGQVNAAKELIEITLQGLTDLSLDEAKYNQAKENLALLTQKCESHENSGGSSKSSFRIDSSVFTDQSACARLTDNQMIFAYKTANPPKLEESNPSIPALSKKVRLAWTPSEGRHLVAEEDIHPGILWINFCITLIIIIFKC